MWQIQGVRVKIKKELFVTGLWGRNAFDCNLQKSPTKNSLSHTDTYYLLKKSRVGFCVSRMKSIKEPGLYILLPNHLLHDALTFITSHLQDGCRCSKYHIPIWQHSHQEGRKKEEKVQKTLLFMWLLREEHLSRSSQKTLHYFSHPRFGFICHL